MQRIICTAAPYVSSRKNVRFTMKLFATCHVALGRYGESRRSNMHLFIMYCSRLFVVVLQEMNCLHTFKHDVVRQITEFHLSTKFHIC